MVWLGSLMCRKESSESPPSLKDFTPSSCSRRKSYVQRPMMVWGNTLTVIRETFHVRKQWAWYHLYSLTSNHTIWYAIIDSVYHHLMPSCRLWTCALPQDQKYIHLIVYFFCNVSEFDQTAQLLEALHAQDSETSASIPSGLLLANDNDSKRTHLLIHQSARLPSPAFMVTNLDASNYPSIRVPFVLEGKTRLDTLSFDRILCDVPCSGDGTLRKNVGIWKSWQPMDGNGLHRYAQGYLGATNLFTFL